MTSLLRRLDHLRVSWRLTDPAGGLPAPFGSASRMRRFIVMVGIAFRTPKWVLQKLVHRPNSALAKRKKSMADLGAALRTVWLEGDVPGCGAELKVRAAEALGAWSVASKEPKTDIVKRLKSKRFEHRMWAARAVRAADRVDADKLLAPLATDPYEDDNASSWCGKPPVSTTERRQQRA